MHQQMPTFLQEFFISDIVSGNGRLLLLEARDGKQLQNRYSRWKWPRQPRPPKSHWKLWDIAIREIWIQSETRVLRFPLGNWLAQSHQIHKFVFDAEQSSIFETHTNGTISKYVRVQGRTRHSNFYMYHDTINSLPNHAVPTTVQKPSQRIIYGEMHMEEIRHFQINATTTW